MLKIDAGSSPNPYCDGLTRRSFVQLGVAGMASGAKLGMEAPSDEPVSLGPAAEGVSVRLSNGRAMFRSPPDCQP